MMIRCSSCFEEYDESLGICPSCGYSEGEQAEEAFCLAPGTIIANRYVIGKMLGLGGFGITYKAWDKKLNSTLAIKEYYPSGLVNRLPGETAVLLVASKREREFVYGKTRFLEEARNMAKFNTHKNIVNVFDFFEANNTAYIVMEFLDGRTLSQVLQQQNVPLPYDYCVNVASDVCSALRAIHKEGILHRDISPDNIMICNNGTVKLFDFGAARFSAGIENRVTVVVKPGFAPPEQYDRVNRQDPRTDIYALGATLYYSMTGIRPEESTNRKIEDTLADPATIDNKIPANISNAIMRAMAIEQQFRFSSVDEFEKALLSEKQVLSVAAEKRKRRNARIAGIAISMLVIIGVASFISMRLYQQKAAATLPDANISLLYFENDEDQSLTGLNAALREISDYFTKEYSNVSIDITGVNPSDWQLTVGEYSEKEITIFESTNQSETDLQNSIDLSELFDDTENKTYLRNELNQENQIPTGIICPVVYINSTLNSFDGDATLENIIVNCETAGRNLVVTQDAQNMYTTLFGTGVDSYCTERAREDFLNGNAYILLGTSSDYYEVQSTLPGEYTIMMPESEISTYQYGTQWSLVAGTDTRAAMSFLSYLQSPLAQDYFHIQHQSSDLPILKSTMEEFIGVYDELSGIIEYLDRPFVAPESENADDLTADESATTKIPQTIIFKELQVADDFLPKINFSNDGSCELVLNMAEWMQTVPASYELFEYSDGSRVIKCVLSTPDLGDGIERELTEFILVETSNNTWTFYGQLMGLTTSGAKYTAADDSTVELDSEIIKPFSPKTGEYQNEFNDLNIIENNESGKILFDVDWYRLTGMSNAEATVYGNYAIFFYTYEGSNDTYGYLEFIDEETVNLTLTETRLTYLDPSSYQYSYVSEEELQQQAIAGNLSILLLNDSSKGWCKQGYNDYGQNYFDEVFMHFSDDGTLRYWTGIDENVEVSYTSHTGTFKLESGILYVDDYEYEIFAESTGGAYFYLSATDQDPLDLSGQYTLKEDEVYAALLRTAN